MAALALTTAILLISFSLIEGMFNQFKSNATDLVIGQVQIHAPGYLIDRSFYKAVDRPDQIVESLKKKGIPAVERSFGYGLVSNGPKASGVRFWGIDPAGERTVSDIPDHVAQGSYIGSKADRKMVIGPKLAVELNLTIGSEVIVVVQAADGSLGNDIYRVCGILKQISQELDRGAVLMHRDDFRELFVSGGRVHEISVNSRGALPLDQVATIARTAAPGEEVKTWRILIPALAEMIGMFEAYNLFLGGIFFLAAGLGVLNTMLMSAADRIREFGVLLALGASPGRIVRDVCAEAVLLGLASSLVGTAIGLAVGYYLSVQGIDASAMAGATNVGGVALDPVWRASLSWRAVGYAASVTVVTALAASLYPAVSAARQDPVRAMTKV